MEPTIASQDDGPRPPAANEAEILRRLAEAARPKDREIARCQVDHLTVTPEADGCALLLKVDERCPRLSQDRGFVSNAEGLDEHAPFVVLLHVRNGYLYWLEAYRRDGGACDGLPPAHVLTYLGA